MVRERMNAFSQKVMIVYKQLITYLPSLWKIKCKNLNFQTTVFILCV